MDANKVQQSQKVGADGLTKKERRALKLAAAGKNTEPKKPVKAGSEACANSKLKGGHSNPPAEPRKIIGARLGTCTNPKIIKNEPPKSPIKLPDVNKDLPNSTESNNVKPEAFGQRRVVVQNVVNDHLKNAELKKCQSDAVKVQDGGLSKAELRAQRRALQEAQRLAKVDAKAEQAPKLLQSEKSKQQKPAEVKVALKKSASNIKTTQNTHKVALFKHLYVDAEEFNLQSAAVNISGVHASFLKLGAQYSSKTILGSNARCLALLSALKHLTSDFSTPPKKEFYRSLETTLQTCVTYLNSCRPLAVSMMNALQRFKIQLTQKNTNLSDSDKRTLLLKSVDEYIRDEIEKAAEAISMEVQGKISAGDVILTYGCSSLITKILLDAHKAEKQFKVIVVDGRPLLEGREMLRKLVRAGIPCSYVLINAASFVMGRVNKVLLGAHALLANGYVMARTGTAQVALLANAYKKPVLVCCETYKFCERVQTDSFVYNEIGDPDKLVTVDTVGESSPLTNWRSSKCLTPLNLMYDVTPPDLVTAVVTELAVLPCTSVPVVLRIRTV